jgi:outer membrane protein TolC
MTHTRFSQLILALIICAIPFSSTAQKRTEVNIELTLEQAIDLARKQSIESFRSKNMYLSRYWQFRSYRAEKLPILGLNSTPINYDRSAALRYNYTDSVDTYIRNETLSSDVNLSLRQNIAATGAVISATSNLARIDNIKQNKLSFNSSPISIGISQPLNGYNAFRWRSRIEPLKFEKAKREFIQSIEDLSIRATDNFFRVVSSEINLKIAETNFSNADTLFRIAKGRFEIGTVTQDELLDFELSFLNSKIDLTKAKLSLQQSRFSLNSYLGLDDNVVITCKIPDQIIKRDINIDNALTLAIENNPQILGFNQQLLEAQRNVAQTRSQTGLGATVSGNFGLNRTANSFENAYQTPFDDQQRLRVTLNVPIVDWGLRKGQIQMAKSDREVTEATVRQARIDFEQSIFQQVMEYNLQGEQVEIAAKADTIAQMGYDVTKQRFMIDKVDVIRLNSARNSLDAAKRNYIDALRRYWSYYFTIRKLTLYDFDSNTTLLQDFDQLMEQP